MQDTGSERRNFARERTQIAVEIWKDLKRFRGTVEYLSFGGAFISAPQTFPRDSEIELKFDIPGEPTTFEGSAKVVWVQKDKAMGIQFNDLPFSEKLKLEKILIR
jgi:Tfp pilus assembly protein PilZ